MSIPERILTVESLPTAVKDTQLASEFIDGKYVQGASHWKRGDNIGRGGFGTVWKEKCVYGLRRNELRAVKHVHLEDRGLTLKDCVRELEALAEFSGQKYRENFVEFYGWFELGGDIGIAMEYCKRGDLNQFLQTVTENLLTEPKIRQIVQQILNGIQLFHESGFAHRDLKPHNILIRTCPPQDRSWHVKISDLGISKRISSSVEESVVIGTLRFMPPELKDHVDQPRPASLSTLKAQQAADVWAIGKITQELFTKGLGFGSFDDVCSQELVSSPQGRLAIEFVDGLLQRNPLERPTASEAIRHSWFAITAGTKESQTSADLEFRSESNEERAPWSSSESRSEDMSFLSLSASNRVNSPGIPRPALVGVEPEHGRPAATPSGNSEPARSIPSDSRSAAVFSSNGRSDRNPVDGLGIGSSSLVPVDHGRLDPATAPAGSSLVEATGSGRLSHRRTVTAPLVREFVNSEHDKGLTRLPDPPSGPRTARKATQSHPILLGRITPDGVRRSNIILGTTALGSSMQQSNWDDTAILDYGVQFSPDGNFLVMVGDGEIRVIESVTGRPRFPGIPLGFSNNGTMAAVGLSNSNIVIYDVPTDRKKLQLEPHVFQISHLRLCGTQPPSSFSPDDQFFAVYLEEQEALIIWSMVTARVVNKIHTKDRSFAWAFSPSTSQLLVCSSYHWSNNTENTQAESNVVFVSFYHAHNMQFSTPMRFQYDGGGVACLLALCFSKDCDYIVIAYNKSGGNDPCSIKVFDIGTGELAFGAQGDRALRSIKACPSGNFNLYYAGLKPQVVDIKSHKLESMTKKTWWKLDTGLSGKTKLPLRCLTILNNARIHNELPLFRTASYLRRKSLRQNADVIAWSADGSKVAIQYGLVTTGWRSTAVSGIIEVWDIGGNLSL